jgi:hypothetical protein
MQPNIVWRKVATRRSLQAATGLNIVAISTQTRHLEMSKSFPAMVETVVSKVSMISAWCLLSTSVVPSFHLSGAFFPPVVPSFHLSGAFFPPQWCLLSTTLIFSYP